jgi:hypothetical protein
MIMTGSALAKANGEIREKLKVENVDRELVTYSKKSLTISTDCLRPHDKFKCDAYTAFGKRKQIVVPPGELHGGSNPGGYKCRKLGGTVLIGTEENHDEMSVCKFDDGSLLDIGSLDGMR